MRRSCILFLLFFCLPRFCIAATVGNSIDTDVPARSAILRQEVIEQTLDECEQTVKIKNSIDGEFIFDKDLNASSELSSAEMEGKSYMAKLGITFFDRVEPYVKVGSSDLEAKWTHGTTSVKVDADNSLSWGGGVKALLWEFEDYGICLTGDFQYKVTDADVKECLVNSSKITGRDTTFKIDEWQGALVVSKKFEIPLKWQSIYIVPYTGVDAGDSKVDVSFKDAANTTVDYSLYKANSDSIIGFVVGCDVMPSLSSSFSYNIELRLFNETALSAGGTMKF